MSRRRGEFEHRTSIFEGAFRAWSHLGGLEPDDLESLGPEQLDPLGYLIENDPRLAELERDQKKSKSNNGDANAIATNVAGIGENKDGSADIAAFDENRRLYPYEPLPRSGLAHPFVQAVLSPWLGPDAEQDAIQLGLTTLRTWWQHRRKGESGSAIVALGTQKMRGIVNGYTRHFFNLAFCLVMKDGEPPPRTLMSKMKEVEKVNKKKVKKRVREEETGKLTALALNAGLDHGIDPSPQVQHAACVMPSVSTNIDVLKPVIDMSGQCIPGKLDLPGLVQQISHANQLVHRGNITPLSTLSNVSSSVGGNATNGPQVVALQPLSSSFVNANVKPQNIGNPNTFPVVFLSESGDVLILMTIDGVTSGHCIKIVETVLKGCDGNKSPISGLLDCCADQMFKLMLIKIDTTLNAKRISYEATRNLSMVGYTAKPVELNFLEFSASAIQKQFKVDAQMMCTAFEVVGSADPITFFDWQRLCICSPLGVEKDICPRHMQMNGNVLQCFQKRKDQIASFMNNCMESNNEGNTDSAGVDASSNMNSNEPQQPTKPGNGSSTGGGLSFLRRNSRLRQSATSEAGFGRAMSGLSALSIDWENMEDFDVNIDHSSHINNANLSEPIVKKGSSCCGGGGSGNDGTKASGGDEENNTGESAGTNTGAGISNGCAMLRGENCDCGPTCACVGCPIHDKSNLAGENVLRSFPKRPSILRKSNNPAESSSCCGGGSGSSGNDGAATTNQVSPQVSFKT